MKPKLPNVDETTASPSALKVHAFGGIGEVGMNLLGLEIHNEMLVFDCGVMFQDMDVYGLEFSMPNLPKLEEFKDIIQGIVFTHGHEDHIGASGLFLKCFPDSPMVASPLTRDLILSRADEFPELNRKRITLFKEGQPFQLGSSFTITPVCVAHSIPDAYGFVVDTPVGRLILSGDFRYDYDDLDAFKQTFHERSYFAPYLDRPIFCYFGDSTNVDGSHVLMTEQTVSQNLADIIDSHRGGLLIITLFSSNMERMGAILAAAKRHGKKVVLCGRSVRRYLEIAWRHGVIPKQTEFIIDEKDIKKHARQDIVAMATGSQAEPKSALMRMALGMHRHIKPQPGDRVIMSSKFIPGNERAISRMMNKLMMQGVEIVTEKDAPIHISGHAYAEESELTLRALKPHYFIPVHGEYHHLVSHSQMAKRLGADGPKHTVLMRNGQVVALSDERAELVNEFDTNKWTFDFGQLMPLSSPVISQRKRMARYGLVICAMEPEVRLFGLGVIIDEECHTACQDYYRQIRQTEQAHTALLRTFIRRYFREHYDKRPYIIVTQSEFKPFDFLGWDTSE